MKRHPVQRSARVLGWLLAGLLLSGVARAEDAPRVHTGDGDVVGLRRGGAELFLGIPFAAPPTGLLRWQPPQPVTPWSDVRAADRLPPECAQLPSPNGPGSVQEDCLYLSVYRPPVADAKRGGLPVLFWIHGGASLNGSGSQQDASELAARTGTIVVMTNYRLGVFGYLALPALGAEAADGVSGNLALLDQQAALRWVQREIGAFGGDPERVTIAGQSAGGASVCMQLASPGARGLFSGAIIQSGAFELPGIDTEPCSAVRLEAAEAAGNQFAGAAGCPPSLLGDPLALACLRLKSAQELLAASGSFVAQVPLGGSVLPVPVTEAIRSGDWNRVNVMIGSTHDELQPVSLLIGLVSPPTPGLDVLVSGFVFGADAARVQQAYLPARFAGPMFAQGAMLGDASIACPTHRLRSLLAQATRTYGFEFDDRQAPPGLLGGMRTGAFHTSDVQYLFRFAPLPGPTSAEQRALAGQVMDYWAAFAAQGRPRVAGAAQWPAFTPEQPRVLALRTGESRLIDDFPTDHRCELWESIF